jgi:tetratricopeptide (TPR) repeat protein
MPLLLLRTLRYSATGLLLLSLLLPWMSVPVGVRGNIQTGYSAMVTEPMTTQLFKAFLLLVIMGGWWFGNRRRRSQPIRWTTLIAFLSYCSLVAITIAYPALTIQRCAALSAHAAWMERQNASMIRFNGDLRTAQEFVHRTGEPEVYVKQVLPSTFAVFSTPISSFFDLRLAKLPEILAWLGFCPAFFEFVRLGWFSGVFGSLLLALSFSRTENILAAAPQRLSGIPLMVWLLVLAPLLLCLLCLTPVMLAGRELASAREAAAEGQFKESLRRLDAAEILLPILACQTDLIYQRGWLDRKLGARTPEAQLTVAIREETEGFDTRAAEHYLPLLEPVGIPQSVHDEAFRGTLRLAINDFNAGLFGRATATFEKLLALDPTCLKANYALQLADLRTSRKDRLEDEVASFIAIYSAMQSIEKRVAIAAAHRRIANLDFDARDTARLGDEMRAAIGQ